jgi:NAD(P)-dependent dehydrogenase (short-subunit alcohol dehydrogenase family)
MTTTRPLAGRRVIVTGGAQGLGREFSLHMAALGAHVLAADIEAEPLRETSELAEDRGTPILTCPTDVSDSQQTDALVGVARTAMGGLDALVNNAAVVAALTRRPFEEIGEEEWDRVLAVNLKGAWLCAKAAVPLLRAAGRGSIVNMASEVAFSGSPGLAHYDASKAALIGLTRVLARELGPDQIRVNALAPGFIPTEASARLSGAGYDTSFTPLGRLGQPSDLLGALTFLLSDDSAFITGQTLLVNGGRLLH